uniref:Reverse transcriptase Ty1/copia-type domain-containing protein n=1 Tax=Solanum tuberosum TaxID=4113 RepID=M1BMX2_SOLTU
MEEELLALKENNTWDIVPCPPNVRKWVYSIKLNSDGTLDRYKARLVVFALLKKQ